MIRSINRALTLVELVKVYKAPVWNFSILMMSSNFLFGFLTFKRSALCSCPEHRNEFWWTHLVFLKTLHRYSSTSLCHTLSTPPVHLHHHPHTSHHIPDTFLYLQGGGGGVKFFINSEVTLYIPLKYCDSVATMCYKRIRVIAIIVLVFFLHCTCSL